MPKMTPQDFISKLSITLHNCIKNNPDASSGELAEYILGNVWNGYLTWSNQRRNMSIKSVEDFDRLVALKPTVEKQIESSRNMLSDPNGQTELLISIVDNISNKFFSTLR